MRLQGATPVAIKLTVPDFAINWDEVRAAITPRTRMIIINTPHNPSGRVLSADDLNQLAMLIRNTDIVVLSDEVYEHVVFDGEKHHGMATHPHLAERSVIISSFGKTYHVTGWRVGYCVAPAALMDEICKVHQFLMFFCRYADAVRFLQSICRTRLHGCRWPLFISKSVICSSNCCKTRRSAYCRAPALSSCWRIIAISAMSMTARWSSG